MTTYNYTIVGSGAAGSVLAYRLGEDPNLSVLVIEAGKSVIEAGEDMQKTVESTSRWNELLLTSIDWAYNSIPKPGLDNHQVYSASGKSLGGSSNLFQMMHGRARREDLDNWAYNGAPGWSFVDCLPYFQKSEHQVDDTNPTAGMAGPLNIINAGSMGNPISHSWLDGCAELGYPIVDDFNAAILHHELHSESLLPSRITVWISSASMLATFQVLAWPIRLMHHHLPSG